MSSSGTAFTWMGIIARTALASLAPLRLLPNLELSALGDLIWLRGGDLEKTERYLLEALPWNNRYEIVSGKYLRPVHSLLPVGRIPVCTWVPISTFIQPVLPNSLLPGAPSGPAPLRWVAALEERRPGFLLAQASDWRTFAEGSSLVRLQHLKFAQSAAGFILISGWPLPPLPGAYFYEDEGIALPAGYAMQPRLSRTTLTRVLQLKGTDLAILHLDGSYSVIPESAWAKASRSAVRLSFNAQSYA